MIFWVAWVTAVSIIQIYHVVAQFYKIDLRILLFVTMLAVQHGPQKVLPPAFCEHPGAAGQRRIVPHMLAMAAGQIGHPITHLIFMKANYLLLHFTQIVAAISYCARAERIRGYSSNASRSGLYSNPTTPSSGTVTVSANTVRHSVSSSINQIVTSCSPGSPHHDSRP